ncbi:MAG TPA: ATP-binding protein [Acidimicrobiia bacterium]|nr:ATP-binding protein [Acidimicrobiia bacterium]
MGKATEGRAPVPDDARGSAAPRSAVLVGGAPRRSLLQRALRRDPGGAARAEAQRLVRQISRELLERPTGERQLSEAIGTVGRFLDCDATALLEVTADDRTLQCSAQWHDPSIPDWEPVPPRFPLSTFPWLETNFHRIRVPFVVPRLADLPANADTARSLLGGLGVRSFGVVPLRRDGRVAAILFVVWCSDGRVPSLERLDPLVVVADVLLGALARRNVEVELRESESRFRAVLRESPDVVVLYRDDGGVEFASAALERITGVAGKAFDFEHAPELVHADDVLGMCVRYGEALAQPREPVPVALRVRAVDGTWRHLEGTLTNLLDEPSVAGVVLNARDVTDRVGLELQLSQAQKMAALGRMAGSVAHDFRNLTFAIRSFAELARGHAERGEPATTELDEIVRGCIHADSLVSQLLAFGQPAVTRSTVVDPGAALAELRPALERLSPPAVNLEIVLAADLPFVGVSRTQLEQILVNLVTNAVDAMPGGGTLRIAVDAPESWLRIEVTDTGVGMDDSVRDQVFEPFFTTKADGTGTGLGLSIVYAVTAAAGGSVSVESEPGAGTTVRVVLPPVEASGDTPGPVGRPVTGEV